ncbi:DNA invertase Pin-like site-specific DNA recombinase [Serinibacter salmoneus]|uniref:DNA invertase Pin-like site-specific DNA recombinase n=1 Tax=Serinibacter salmoneus TaxID=556530 RepID=A0A2A9D417_9MICO|nr:DNA invertase Pin-like site-specific DNA recombinase [Serinibacter salmoneus]
MVPRAVAYLRQSVTEDQGIQQQLDDLQAEVARRGWTLLRTYVDNDVSATKARGESTAWAKMLGDFDAGDFDTLLVTETSRLTRSLTDVLEVRPPRRNIRVVTVREGIDTANDDFSLKILVLVAEKEIETKRQRAARYAAERRLQGHPTAGLTPHGYRWVPAGERDASGARYAVVADEAADVKRIYSEYLGGAPLAQIARDLNSAGRRTRAGARWAAPTVRRVLLNPVYAALLQSSQESGKHSLAAIDLAECRPGAWPPIIERSQLEAARGRLLGVKPNHAGTARAWLLSGLALCAVCREPVRSARGETHPTPRRDGSGAATSQRYHAYRCVNGHFMRNGDIIDKFVAVVATARIAQADTRPLVQPAADEVDVGALSAHREELRGRRSAIAGLIAAGHMSSADAEEALVGLDRDIAEVETSIARALMAEPLAEFSGVQDAQQWWDEATLARRRSFIEQTMEVLIHPVGKGRRVTSLEACADTVTIEWLR